MVVDESPATESSNLPTLDQVWGWLSAVEDPEIPAISIVDLGIVRDVSIITTGVGAECLVTITPTYSGCPATAVIAQSIRDSLGRHGLARVTLETRIAPAWTTDWISAAGKQKLKDYGIAPPGTQVIDVRALGRNRLPVPRVACPRCESTKTEVISQFGSTPCKALYRCRDCLEPFDYFKCH